MGGRGAPIAERRIEGDQPYGDRERMDDLVNVGRSILMLTGRDPAAFERALVNEFGERVRPLARDAYDRLVPTPTASPAGTAPPPPPPAPPRGPAVAAPAPGGGGAVPPPRGPAPGGRTPDPDIDAMVRRPEPSLGERLRQWGHRTATGFNRWHPAGVIDEALERVGVRATPGTTPKARLELFKNITNGQAEDWQRRMRSALDPVNRADLGDHLRDYLVYKQALKRVRDLSADPESRVDADGYFLDANGQRTGRVANPINLDRPEAERRLAELERALVPADRAMVEQAAKDIWALNREILDMNHDASVISDEAYQAIIGRGDDYVPFQVLDYLDAIGGHAGPQSPVSPRYQSWLKSVSGTDRDVRDPRAASLDKGLRGIALANRNLATRAITDHADQIPDVVRRLRPDESATADEGIVYAWENGTRVGYAVPPEVAEMLTAMTENQARLFTGILSAGRTTLQAGATGYNLGFAVVTNPPRDIARAFKYSLAGFPTNWFTALKHVVQNAPERREALRAGALYTFQRDITPEAFVTGEGGPQRPPVRTGGGILRTAADLGRAAVWAVGRTANVTEEATKLATYEKLRKRGWSPADAAYEAANYGGSPNFSLNGPEGQMANLFLMFFKARLQGTIADAKRVTTHPGRTVSRAFPLRVATLSALPLTLLWLYNHQYGDDAGLADVPERDRENYHVVLTPWTYESSQGDTRRLYFRIGKDSTDQFIGTPIEALLDRWAGEDPEAVAKTAADMLGAVSPVTLHVKGGSVKDLARGLGAGVLASTNPVLRTPLEAGFNYRAYAQAPIVPRGLDEGVLPEFQAQPWTSATMRKLGKIVGVAPARLEHVITSSTGGLGQTALAAADYAQGTRQPETLSWPETLAKAPLLGRLVGTGGGQKDREIERRFYDLLDESRRYVGTAGLAEKGQAGEQDVRAVFEGNPRAQMLGDKAQKGQRRRTLHADLQEMAEALGTIRRSAIYFTHHAKDIPVEKRREAIRELARQRHEILGLFQTAEKATENFSRPMAVAP